MGMYSILTDGVCVYPPMLDGYQFNGADDCYVIPGTTCNDGTTFSAFSVDCTNTQTITLHHDDACTTPFLDIWNQDMIIGIIDDNSTVVFSCVLTK